jgi:hypothetical protein
MVNDTISIIEADENTTHVIESFYKTRHDPLG